MNVYESIMRGLNEALEYENGNAEAARVMVRSSDSESSEAEARNAEEAAQEDHT